MEKKPCRNMGKYLAMDIQSDFKTFMLVYIMTITMVTTSELAGSGSHFSKWREHTQYRLPVTSLQFTYDATSEFECAIVCCARSGFKPCAGFAFISMNDQWTCALAIKVTMGT